MWIHAARFLSELRSVIRNSCGSPSERGMEELNIINRHQQQIENNSEPFQTTAQIRNRAQIRGGVAPRSAPGRRKKPSVAGIGGGRPRAKRLQKSYSTEQFCTKNFAYDTECEMERVQLPKLRGSVGSSIKPLEAPSYCLKKMPMPARCSKLSLELILESHAGNARRAF